jgi:hypothetical protein
MGLNHSPKIVTDNLVLCLDALNPKSYLGSGTTWTDLSGKNNHCNFVATPSFSNGIFTFNGTSHYGTITNSATMDFSEQQTIMFLFKSTGTTGRRNPWNQAYGGYGTWTDECASSAINYYYGDAGTNNVPYVGHTSSTVSRNVWYLVSSTRNLTGSVWYRNDAVATTFTHTYGSLTADTNNILIGYGYAGFWQGDMQMVLAYTKELSLAEIRQNFNALRGRFGL